MPFQYNVLQAASTSSMNIDHYTNQLLQAILDELRASKQMLGFGHPPKPRYIYANRQYPNCLWYFWNGAKNEHEPIEYHAVSFNLVKAGTLFTQLICRITQLWSMRVPAFTGFSPTLTGIVERLEIEEKEFRGKPDLKVNLHIRADRNYIIQAGYETLFAKGLLYTLSKLPTKAFTQPITLAVEPGDTEQVLFCRIYNPTSGQAVYAPYADNTDWQAVLQRAIAKIDSAHGRGEQVVQTA